MRTFTIKTGKNKGFYVVAPKDLKNKALDITKEDRKAHKFLTDSASWGYYTPEYYGGLYKKHNVDKATQAIWGHAKFANAEFYRRSFWSAMKDEQVKERLEYLRGEIEAERISYAEIAELEGLKDFIEEGDTLLLEWAGVSKNN